MKGAKLLVDTLVDLGITNIAGIIGSSIDDVIDALSDDGRIRYISVRHEQVAASISDGYARVSSKPMACIAHAGPGACNLVLGVASAFRDSVPMLVITGNTGSSRLGRDAWHELDVLALFRPITKSSVRISRAGEISQVLRSSLATALDGRPGPVHIDIPQDIMAAELPAGAPADGDAPGTIWPSAGVISDGVIAPIRQRLAAAKRPVILAGGGVASAGASFELTAVAEAFSMPVVTTETARGLVPEDHPLCLGIVGLYGNPGSNRALREADVILGVGCRFSEQATLGWKLIDPSTSIIQINIDARELGKQFPIDVGVIADAGSFLATLLNAEPLPVASPISRANRIAWAKELQEMRAVEQRDFFAKALDTTPLKPQRLIQEIINLAGRDSIFAVGQGNLTASCIRAPIYAPGQFLQSVGLGAMGFAFPAALGAALAAPAKTVFCLVGDGDFGMVMQDLDTAAREDLKVIIVVFNNGGYGVNRIGQLARKREPYGVDFINPDFAELAKMYGLQGFRIERPEQLRPSLEEALNSRRTVLLDVMIDPFERVGSNPKAVGLYT
jgi:acetolactate synthase I/II/III large subunit